MEQGRRSLHLLLRKGQQVEWNQQVAINGRVALTIFTREMKKKKVSRFVETINR